MINVLNDYFVRYLLSSSNSSLILLDFINSIMLDSEMKTFRAAEILNPFNYKENYEDKETIVDVKCITKWYSCYNRDSAARQFKISRANTILLGF